MENLLQLALYLVVYIIVCIFLQPTKTGTSSLRDSINNLFDLFTQKTGTATKETSGWGTSIKGFNDTNVKQAIDSSFKKVIDASSSIIKGLGDLSNNIVKILSEKEEARPWRVVGALLYLVLLIVFIIADLVQGISNASGLYSLLDIPDLLKNLFFPLIAASSASAFILGSIIADFLGFTNLAPWEKVKDSKAGRIFLWLTVSNAIIVIALSFFVALVKIPSFGEGISPDVARDLRNLASIALSIVIFPMLVTNQWC